MKIAIVAGGPEDLLPDLHLPEYQDCVWIGADHGTIVLLKNRLLPVRAFGDFDSLSDKEKENVFKSSLNLSVYPAEKDKTDLEIAVDWALQKEPDQLLIFGVTGGRVDHMLAAVQMLLKAEHLKTDCMIIDRKNCISLLTPGIYHIKSGRGYPYLSFLALSGKVSGLSLQGVKYPLHNAELPVGSSLCISNEPLQETFTVSLLQGCLLMMRCSD